MLRGENGCLRFLVHPELRKIVQGQDLVYIEALLQDFLKRAQKDSAALFKQISSLGVGSLVTHETGPRLSEHPSIVKLTSQFVQVYTA